MGDFENSSDRQLLESQTNFPPFSFSRMGLRKLIHGGLEAVSLNDFAAFQSMQQSSFGAETPFEVIRQILLQDKGMVFSIHDMGDGDKRVGYIVLVTGKLDEVAIQHELDAVDASSSTKKGLKRYFTDHYDYELPEGAVDLHEIAIDPAKQRQGIGTVLARSIRNYYENQYGMTRWIALVRINNIGSLKALTEGVNMSMVGIQGPPDNDLIVRLKNEHGVQEFHGSKETNFRADSNIPCCHDLPEDSKDGVVWKPEDPTPSTKHFFLAMSAGEQGDLAPSGQVIDMLKQVMAVGRYPQSGDYVMSKVCTAKELRDSGVQIKDEENLPYLFFTREWRELK